MTRIESLVKAAAEATDERVNLLHELFPEVITEGKIDFEKLRLVLGDDVEEDAERYSFTWAGKRAAVNRLQQHSRSSMVPDREKSVNFEASENIFVEGENLEVLKRLYKSYFGRVKMVYIDPPYNTGGDFIYNDDYAMTSQAYLATTGQQDTEGNYLVSNPETSGRYHSDWLSMMYPRLFLARQLLRDDGIIFVSIDDHEVHNLHMLMNEIFGEENRIETFIWKKTYGGGAKEKYAVTQHEYILLYARNLQNVAELWLPPDAKAEARYYKYKDEKFETRGPYRLKPLEATRSMGRRENLMYGIPNPDGSGDVKPKRQWWWKRERALAALANNELVFTESGETLSISYKQYLRDERGNERKAKPFSVIDGIYTQNGTADLKESFGDPPIMQFPKPVALMKLILSMGTQAREEDIILDFFAGSCSLAQGVLELNHEDGGNRRFICVQLAEPLVPPRTLKDGTVLSTISDIGAERIRRVTGNLQRDGERKLDLSVGGVPEDLGVRYYKAVPSHFRAWESPTDNTDAKAYLSQLEIFTEPLNVGWKSEGVIYEVLLNEGFSLTSTIEPVSMNGTDASVWKVIDDDGERSLYISLDDHISADIAKELNLSRDDVFVCRDRALDDTTAANLALQCRLKVI